MCYSVKKLFKFSVFVPVLILLLLVQSSFASPTGTKDTDTDDTTEETDVGSTEAVEEKSTPSKKITTVKPTTKGNETTTDAKASSKSDTSKESTSKSKTTSTNTTLSDSEVTTPTKSSNKTLGDSEVTKPTNDTKKIEETEEKPEVKTKTLEERQIKGKSKTKLNVTTQSPVTEETLQKLDKEASDDNSTEPSISKSSASADNSTTASEVKENVTTSTPVLNNRTESELPSSTKVLGKTKNNENKKDIEETKKENTLLDKTLDNSESSSKTDKPQKEKVSPKPIKTAKKIKEQNNTNVKKDEGQTSTEDKKVNLSEDKVGKTENVGDSEVKSAEDRQIGSEENVEEDYSPVTDDTESYQNEYEEVADANNYENVEVPLDYQNEYITGNQEGNDNKDLEQDVAGEEKDRVGKADEKDAEEDEDDEEEEDEDDEEEDEDDEEEEDEDDEGKDEEEEEEAEEVTKKNNRLTDDKKYKLKKSKKGKNKFNKVNSNDNTENYKTIKSKKLNTERLKGNAAKKYNGKSNAEGGNQIPNILIIASDSNTQKNNSQLKNKNTNGNNLNNYPLKYNTESNNPENQGSGLKNNQHPYKTPNGELHSLNLIFNDSTKKDNCTVIRIPCTSNEKSDCKVEVSLCGDNEKSYNNEVVTKHPNEKNEKHYENDDYNPNLLQQSGGVSYPKFNMPTLSLPVQQSGLYNPNFNIPKPSLPEQPSGQYNSKFNLPNPSFPVQQSGSFHSNFKTPNLLNAYPNKIMGAPNQIPTLVPKTEYDTNTMTGNTNLFFPISAQDNDKLLSTLDDLQNGHHRKLLDDIQFFENNINPNQERRQYRQPLISNQNVRNLSPKLQKPHYKTNNIGSVMPKFSKDYPGKNPVDLAEESFPFEVENTQRDNNKFSPPINQNMHNLFLSFPDTAEKEMHKNFRNNVLKNENFNFPDKNFVQRNKESEPPEVNGRIILNSKNVSPVENFINKKDETEIEEREFPNSASEFKKRQYINQKEPKSEENNDKADLVLSIPQSLIVFPYYSSKTNSTVTLSNDFKDRMMDFLLSSSKVLIRKRKVRKTKV